MQNYYDSSVYQKFYFNSLQKSFMNVTSTLMKFTLTLNFMIHSNFEYVSEVNTYHSDNSIRPDADFYNSYESKLQPDPCF